MGRLRSWKHEKFAQEIVAGPDIKEAYVIAGFEQSSVANRNYNRLLKRPELAARIAELKQEHEDAARAARVPIDEVLAQLSGRGIDRVADFFDRDAAGILRVCDLQTVPVEVSIALLRFLREGLGIKNGSP